MLSLQDVHKNYLQGNLEINVLSKLNLQVDKNKNIGIIGPSGSGKTTLLNLIGLLEEPSTGEIFIDGQNCTAMKSEDKTSFRKKNIGFIFQNNQLLEDFNVLENVALPLILNGENFKYSMKKAKNYLDILGLVDRINFKPALLSGGEQQRVAIARALIKKPLILLADEPTGSLDDQTSVDVFNFIIKLSKQNNTLTIIATHNLKLINNLDICYKINKGDVIENK